jgi:hypothetical protein
VSSCGPLSVCAGAYLWRIDRHEEGPMDVPDTAAVAAMLDTLSAADRRLAEEFDAIAASPAPVSQATVRRLEGLLETLRPAVGVRAALSGIPAELIGAAFALRRRGHAR